MGKRKFTYIFILSMFFLMDIVSLAGASINFDSQSDINTERIREKEQTIKKILEGKKNYSEYPENKLEKGKGQKGSQIKEIIVEGNEILSDKEINQIKKKYVGKFGGINVINFLKELENKYLNLGYAATRVKLNSEKSNVEKGTYTFVVLHGKIEDIIINNINSMREYRFKKFATFPIKEGDIINIKDLDQAMDNLTSISSNDPVINVSAGSSLGTSVITVENKKSRTVSGYVGYNNLGQEVTGEDRGRIALTIEDLLGMNDSFTGIYQQKFYKEKHGKNNKSFFFYYRIPIKYWEVVFSREYSDYKTEVDYLGQRIKFKGDSVNYNFTLSRVVYRNSEGKIGISMGITTKDPNNYIEDIKLITNSKRLTVLKFDVNTQRKFLGGYIYGDIGVNQGIRSLGGERDRNKASDEPKGEFTKYTLDLNYYRPFLIFGHSGPVYRGSISGQYSNDVLYSSEKITVGDDVSVRGFKNSSSMGDKGIYLRNELGYKVKYFEPFVGFDIGRTKNTYKDPQIKNKKYGDQLAGISAGIRFEYKYLFGSVSLSKGIEAPGYIIKEDHEVYLNFGIKF